MACRAFGVSETCYRYSPLLSGENDRVADLLIGLTDARKTWGFGLCFLHLRNVQGHSWNHKRIYRIYFVLELNQRIKPRKRLKREVPDALSAPNAPNVTWSMDFMADRLAPFMVCKQTTVGQWMDARFGCRMCWTISIVRVLALKWISRCLLSA